MDLQAKTTTLFGSPTTKGQLYGGLYLLAGGVALGLISLFLFFFSSGQPGSAYFAWREGALAVGAIALTCFFVGVSIALPSKRSMRIASYVGMGFCTLAIILFMVHYPRHFNTADTTIEGWRDYTGLDVSLFAIGLAAIVSGAFTSVVGYYVQRIAQVRAEEKDELEHNKAGYNVPDWVVEKDLADAEKRFGVEWGQGLSGNKDFHQFQLGQSILEGGQLKGMGRERRVQVAATEVEMGEQAFKGLRKEKAAIPGQWADESVASLRSFRKQQKASPKHFTPRIAWYLRLWDFLTGRRRAT